MPPFDPRADQPTPPEPPAARRAGEARRRLRESLRRLAATLMSVSRGAGKPWAIWSEVVASQQEFENYRTVIGGYPAPEELSAMLHLSPSVERPTPLSREQLERALSLRAAVRGSLRIAAARLLDLPTEELAGETELFHAIDAIEALRTDRTTPPERPQQTFKG